MPNATPTRSVSLAPGSRPDQNGEFMTPDTSDDMRAEHDFSEALQGKHHRAYQEGTNIVLLEPDVARAFRDSASVNRALRLLMDLARDQTPKNAKQ
jgi:hypothetical protein